jgi:release factor glutamine methyltransferase
MWLITPPGVFAPRSDAGLLLDHALPTVHGEVLDMCTGSGVLALAAAERAAAVTAVDASRPAVTCARANARLNGRRVHVLHGDLFGPVAGRRFDVVLSNPPYLPTAAGGRRPLGSEAWEAGEDGRLVLDRLCAEAGRHLRPGGALVMVHSSLADIDRSVGLLAEAGLEVDVLGEQEGPLGPLARARLRHLLERHLVDEEDPREHMVVLRGRRP